jgi:hypothetical protein
MKPKGIRCDACASARLLRKGRAHSTPVRGKRADRGNNEGRIVSQLFIQT